MHGMPRENASRLSRSPAHERQGDTAPFPHGIYNRGASPVSSAGLNYLVCWRSLRGLFYRGGQLVSGQGVGSDFRGYANQKAHYTELKQIPLR